MANKVLLLLIVAFNMVSAWLAGAGIATLSRDYPLVVTISETLAARTGLWDASTWQLAVCIAGAGLLQAIGNVYWTLLFRRQGFIVPGLIGGIVSGTSAWVSAVLLILNAEGATLAQQNRLEAVAPAREQLAAFSDTLSTTSSALANVAATAAELARVENLQGGTCDGSTATGDGPRTRMRNRHNVALASAADMADFLAQQAIAIDFRLQEAGREALSSVYADGVSLSRSRDMDMIRSVLEPIQRDLTVGWKDGDTDYTCPTPEFLVLVEDALGHLDAVKPLSTDLPNAREVGAADAGAMLVENTLELFSGAEVNDTVKTALVWGFAIEFLQILMIAFREGRMRGLGLSLGALDEFWMSAQGKGRRPHLEHILAALDRYTWYDGEQEFFAAPRPSVPNARLPVDFFGLRLAHARLRHFDLGDIDPAWVEARGLEGAAFDLYSLPQRKIAKWRRAAERDLHANGRASPTP